MENVFAFVCFELQDSLFEEVVTTVHQSCLEGVLRECTKQVFRGYAVGYVIKFFFEHFSVFVVTDLQFVFANILLCSVLIVAGKCPLHTLLHYSWYTSAD